MVEPRAQLDPASLGPVEKLRGPLEDQLTSALNAAVDKVDDHYQGEGVEQVAEDLMEETKGGLHPDIAAKIAPNEDQIRSVAETIVKDNA